MISAVILAAGEGAGAWPYSGIRQKVTAPVANVPMVRRCVRDLQACGVDDIVIVIGHRGPAVRACTADLPGVRFIEQRPLAGPVDAALRGIREAQGEDAIICAGDIVTPRDNLDRLLRAFAAPDTDAALLVAPCPPDAPHYTTVYADATGRLEGVCGHGDRDRPRYGGVAIAPTAHWERFLLRDPGIMDRVEIGAMPPVEGDLARSLDLMREDGLDVVAVPAEGFLIDVDRPWQLLEANRAAAAWEIAHIERAVIGPGASVDDGADIAADARLVLGPGAHIGKGCHIGGSLILGARSQVVRGAILQGDLIVGDDTECKDYCLIEGGSVLGSKCIFGHGSEFGGVTFDTVYLWHYCEISGVLGANVDIGAATVCGTWRFDNGVREQRVKGHRERPRRFGSETYIGDYCRTGVNVMFMPGVKVGAYSCVGAGAIVYDDVPERTLLIPKQEHISKPWGPEKYGW